MSEARRILSKKIGWRDLAFAAVVLLPVLVGQLIQDHYPWVGQSTETNVANLNHYISVDDRDNVERYLAAGTDVNGRSDSKELPLEIAIRYGNLWAANLLLQKGADPNLAPGTGTLLLLEALSDTSMESQQIAPSLIQHGAKVNICDHSGWTPLHWARHNGDSSISALLLKAGADPSAKNLAGKTPAQVAR